MPYECALEMICDYLGAARAYLGKDFTFAKELEWWENKKKVSYTMHPHTKDFVSVVLHYITMNNSAYFLKKHERLRILYDSYRGTTKQILVYKAGV